MTEKAEFEVELIDDVSSDARQVSRAFAGIQASIRKLQGGFASMGSKFANTWNRARQSLVSLGAAGGAFGVLAEKARGLGSSFPRVTSALSALRTQGQLAFIGVTAKMASFGQGLARLGSVVATPFKALGRAGDTVISSVFGSGWKAALGRFAATAQMNFGLVGMKAVGLAKQLGSSLGGAFKKIGGALGKIPWDKAISKIKDMALLGAVLGGAIVGGVVAATVSFVNFQQSMRLGFQQVAHAGENAEALFQRGGQLAEGFGLDVKDTTKALLKFRALQFTQNQAEALIGLGADMRGLGATAEQVQNTFSQLGQIKAKGRLQGEELVVLAENGVATGLVLENLSKQLGKTTDEVQKLLSAGKITASQGLNAIAAAMNQKLGQSKLGQTGKRIADETIGGMAGQLKAKVQRVFGRIADQVEKPITKAFVAIGKEVKGFIDSAQGAKFVGRISRGITALANGIRSAIPFAKQFIGGLVEGFQAAMPDIKGALGLFGDMGKGDWKKTMKELGEALGKIAALAVGAGAVLGGMGVVAAKETPGLVATIGNAWSGMISWIGDKVFTFQDNLANIAAKGGFVEAVILGPLGRLKERAFQAASDLWQGFIDGLMSRVGSVVSTVGSMAESVMGAFDSVFTFGSPSKEMFKRGRWAGEGFALGYGSMPANDVMPAPALPSRADAISQGAARVASAAGSGGGNVFHIQINAKADGGKTPAQNEAAGRAWARGAGAQLRDELEDVAIETGT